jgi:uncharacterized protein
MMPRPHCLRQIAGWPGATYFKPAGIPLRFLEEVTLSLDEFEAVRLADLEGLYQEEAAAKMNISRPTFGRVVESGRKKIANALVNGKALRIEGGVVEMKGDKKMPGRDGTRPSPCGCNQRRGCGKGQGKGLGRHGMRHGATNDGNQARRPSAGEKGKNS